MDFTPFQNQTAVAIASGIAGVILAWVTQHFLNKRGLFSYFVTHARVGVSADDAVFGSVRVTWNGNQVANLYTSTIELVNGSLKDYENVLIRVYSSDTFLLTERTEVVGTTRIVDMSPDYHRQLNIPAGEIASQAQLELIRRQRDYLVPTINRGQILRFHYLNAAQTQQTPNIWVEIVHAGVKVKFQVPLTEFLGVPQSLAALIGVLSSVIVVIFVISWIKILWVAAIVSMGYGLIAQLPGALLIKMWRRTRGALGD